MENRAEEIRQRLDEHDADARSWLNTATPGDVRFLLDREAALVRRVAELEKEVAILIEVMQAIAHDDRCGQHHDAMAQDGLRRAYGAGEGDYCATPKEGDVGQP